MKTTKTIFVLCISLILLTGCSKTQRGKLPIVDLNGVEVANLDLEKLIDTIHVKLSQLAENLHVVALQTNLDGVLSNPIYFIGNKFILAHGSKGVDQFSSDGTYIRKLVKNGGGPGEIPTLAYYCLMEDKDLFLAATRNHIYLYELSSGRFLGTKRKLELEPNEQLNNLSYVQDSIILFSYFKDGIINNNLPLDSLGCGVKLQSLNGKVLWRKNFNLNSWVMHPVRQIGLLGGSNIFVLSTNNPDEFILQISDHDTVYKLNTSTYSIQPSLLRKSETQNKDGFPIDRVAANCFIENNEYANVNGYQLMRFEYVTEAPIDWNYNVRLHYILYDDNNKRAFRIGTFENDYLGFIHHADGNKREFGHLPYLSNPLGKLVEQYDAYEFMKLAKEALNKFGLDEDAKERLLKLTNSLTENSNPILLIGDVKKKIDL
jgi:hypothetical protein